MLPTFIRTSIRKFSSAVPLAMSMQMNKDIPISIDELLEIHAQSMASQAFLARSDHFVMGDDISVLDYGCGDGIVSESLQFNSRSITGVDSNSDLVNAFNRKFRDRGISSDKLEAHTCIPPDSKFDVIVCTQLLHKLNDVDGVINTLSQHLNSDGELLIVDYSNQPFSDSAVLNSTFTGEHIDKPSPNTHPHRHAISSQKVQSAITKAGLIDYSCRPAFLLDYEETGGLSRIPFFIATGLKK
ncbi:hypothetical protein E3P81_00688 [Wallemia ichthyophaga]|nr:hypothetical protein E3P97_00689 [Wallemia ichthyophaga]TIB35233.1 hypothetical protein E3P85_00545 [Wallemia ichthyophaga]TIB50025.1 hypothetical protein E3P82_00686 [Wallemia ichthyophaga]TIB53722.1 hypothetical protein E3P81_00688 [Wallemia ichthyophaga]TIB56278.1 hypothetical protein E3P80_00687 [Wallemia ichthyophaga]